jgi:hypothetical protein
MENVRVGGGYNVEKHDSLNVVTYQGIFTE